ncbi:MAG TPA: chorismate synthase [Firmicutes bacterium]|nr:chorismate synthase [Bacillota bacterium]
MRYLTGGESHGPGLTAIVEGLPAGLELHLDDINRHLARRQLGYGRGGRMAIEKDRVKILSGLRFNQTIGSPLTMHIENRDWTNWQSAMAPEGEAPADWQPVTRPRPGHADLAGGLKYNFEDLRLVLERSSARETAMRTAVGSVGRIFLENFGVAFFSHVLQIGRASAPISSDEIPGLYEIVEKSAVRCADEQGEAAMLQEIDRARRKGDTLGGIFEVIVSGVPPGLGSYVHPDRRLDGRLAGAVMAIQGIKGVEIGIGFAAAAAPGSEVHDPIVIRHGKGIERPSNRAGGLEGGVTNGSPLVVRAVMKPIPTLGHPLPSIDWQTGEKTEGAVERSDICAVPSAAVVAEAVVAWELAVAFREKFGGDYLEEIAGSYHRYLENCRFRLKE